MYRQFYSQMDSITLPMIALGFFVSAFVLMLARTYGFKRARDFEAQAALPLFDEERNTP